MAPPVWSTVLLLESPEKSNESNETPAPHKNTDMKCFQTRANKMSTLHNNTHVPKPHKICRHALLRRQPCTGYTQKKLMEKHFPPFSLGCLPMLAETWSESHDAGAPRRNEVVVTPPNISATFSRANNSLFNVTSGEKALHSITTQENTSNISTRWWKLFVAQLYSEYSPQLSVTLGW